MPSSYPCRPRPGTATGGVRPDGLANFGRRDVPRPHLPRPAPPSTSPHGTAGTARASGGKRCSATSCATPWREHYVTRGHGHRRGPLAVRGGGLGPVYGPRYHAGALPRTKSPDVRYKGVLIDLTILHVHPATHLRNGHPAGNAHGNDTAALRESQKYHHYAGSNRQTFDPRSYKPVPLAVEVFGAEGTALPEEMASNTCGGAGSAIWGPSKGIILERLRKVISTGRNVAVSRRVAAYTRPRHAFRRRPVGGVLSAPPPSASSGGGWGTTVNDMSWTLRTRFLTVVRVGCSRFPVCTARACIYFYLCMECMFVSPCLYS